MTSQSNSDGSSQSVTRFDRAAVFVNERAGGGKARDYSPSLNRSSRARNFDTDSNDADSKELESLAKEAIQGGERLLFAVGGDGTLQGLVNAAYGHDVVLGVIPAGGGNDFARA